MWAIVTTERPSSVVRRTSVNFSHFNQLLWSHWANLNQTLMEWFLDGPLPKLCSVIPTSNQAGRQAKNWVNEDKANNYINNDLIFSEHVFTEAEILLPISKETAEWNCSVCKIDVHLYASDGCLEWNHLKCVGLKAPPKYTYWLCRQCYNKGK